MTITWNISTQWLGNDRDVSVVTFPDEFAGSTDSVYSRHIIRVVTLFRSIRITPVIPSRALASVVPDIPNRRAPRQYHRESSHEQIRTTQILSADYQAMPYRLGIVLPRSVTDRMHF